MRFLTSRAELRKQACIFLVYLLCVGLYGAWREETPGDAERFASQDLCAQIGWTPRAQAGSPVHVTDVVLLADGDGDGDSDVASALLAARALEREGGGAAPVSARVVTPEAGAFHIPTAADPSEEESSAEGGEGSPPPPRRRFFVFAPVSEVPKYPLFWALRACVPPADGGAAATAAGLVVPTTAESYLNDFGCKERAVRGPDVLGGGAWGRRSTPLYNAHPLADTVGVDDAFVALRCGGRVSVACYAAARRAVAGAPTLVLAGLRLKGYAGASEGLLDHSKKKEGEEAEKGEVVVAPVVERAVHRLEVYSDEEYHTQMAIVLRDKSAVPHVESGASLPEVDVAGLVECLREACVAPDFARLADRRAVSVPAWIRAASEGGGHAGSGGGGGAYAWPRDFGPGAALRASYNTSHPQSALLRRVLYTQAHTHPLPAALGTPVVARNRCAAAARHIKQGRKASAKSFPLPVSEREMRRLLGVSGGGGGGGGRKRLVVPVREKGPPLLRHLGGGGGGAGGGGEFGTGVPFGGSAADAADVAAEAAAARSGGSVGSAAWYAGIVLSGAAAVFCVLLFCDVSLCTWASVRRACFGGRHSRRRFGGKV